MPQRFTIGMRGLLQPEVDRRATDRATSDIEDALSEVEQLQPDVDTSSLDGLDASGMGEFTMADDTQDIGSEIAEAMSDSIMGDVLSGGTQGIVGSVAERRKSGTASMQVGAFGGQGDTGAGGTEGRRNEQRDRQRGGIMDRLQTGPGGLMKVALGGAVAVGMLGAISSINRRLTAASPALQQTWGILDEAMTMFFRPFGRFLSDILRPMAMGLLMFARDWMQITSEEGLSVAIASMVGFSIGDDGASTMEREGARGGLLVGAGGGAVTGAKLGAGVGAFGGPIGAGIGAGAGGIAGAITGALVGSRIGAEVAGVIETALMGSIEVLGWETFINTLKWGMFVNGLKWGTWISENDWDEWLVEMSWGTYAKALEWEDWLGELMWDTWITVVNWDTWLNPLKWDTWLNPLEWGTWVTSVNLRDFVTSVNLRDFVTGAIGSRSSDSDDGDGLWPFAEGGVVMNETKGIIAERKPEAVIPLDRIGEVTGAATSGGTRTAGDNSDVVRALSDLSRKLDDVVDAARSGGEAGDVVLKVGEKEFGRVTTASSQKYDSGREIT